MRKNQKGSTLLEGMISILIFSFGVLGTMAFQANMLAQATQTSYRLSASMLVNSLSNAAEADPKNSASFATSTDTNTTTALTGMDCTAASSYVTSWKTQVAAMKGSSTTPPTAFINSEGDLVISVYWKLPQEVAKETKTGESTAPSHLVSATIHRSEEH